MVNRPANGSKRSRSATADSGELLDLDAEFRKQLTDARVRLLPYGIGKHSQLQEWAEDFDEPDLKHRHLSHLIGLFPGRQLTPELAKAVRQSLDAGEQRLFHAVDFLTR